MNALPAPANEDDFLVNLEMETELLGGLMLDNASVDTAADIVRAEDFSEGLLSRIFQGIVHEVSRGNSANAITLKGHFDRDPDIASVGGISFLASLTGNYSGTPIAKVARSVAELASRRRLQAALIKGAGDCGDLTLPIERIVSSIDTVMDERGTENAAISSAEECVESFLADLDREHIGTLNKRIETLDDLIGPLEPQTLTILAARPGMGKSVLAGNYAVGAAREGHGVCFVSLEMSKEQLTGRMIADIGFDDADRRVPYAAIQRRNLNPWQRDRVQEIGKWLSSLPLSIVNSGGLRMGQLERIVRSEKRRMAARGKKLELLIVDYLQLLHPDEKRRSAYEAISEISTRLKGIAMDHGIAVIALAQLSRVVETRTDKRPILSDLRDSGQIEQDADAVLFLLREEYYLRQSEPQNDPDAHEAWQAKLDRCCGVIEFILAKCRHGTTGNAMGRFYGTYQAVR